MTSSKIKDMRADGTVHLEDGFHFAADVDSEGPYVTVASVRVYIGLGQLIGHETIGAQMRPNADSGNAESSAQVSAVPPELAEAGTTCPPDEGNHPAVQASVPVLRPPP